MKRRQGFTVIEVMIAIGVMTVGCMAIIGMQVQAARQNQLARDYLSATQFAQTWVERLKIDALLWTQAAVPNGAPTPGQVLQNTSYLGALLNTGAVFLPITPSPLSLHKQGATHQGYDVPGNSGLTYTNSFGGTSVHSFCADARVAWVYFGRALRADIRVYWPKRGVIEQTQDLDSPDLVTDFGADCNDSDDALRPGTGSLANLYHVVYLPTVLRVTELRP